MATKQTFYTVQEFCNNANWAVATQKNYKYALLHYSRFLFPDKKDPESALSALSDHVRKKTDPAKDIGNYASFMKGKPPKTVGLYLTAVRSYYGLNGHTFNKQEMKRIVPRTGEAETIQGELTTEILRKMTNAADIRGRVLIMLLASTACRLGELCMVQLEDVNMDAKPARIHLKKEYTKNGRARTVFFTDECRDVVKVWLKSERLKYLTASYQRNEGLNDQFKDKNRMLPEKDRRLLGLSTYGARSIWYTTIARVLDKDQLKPDAKTRIHPLSPHVVRKWWRITANAGFRNEDAAHLIMGHWSNSLDFIYAKMGDVGLGKEFLKAQSALSILSSESVKDLKENSEKQADRLLVLEREKAELKERLAALERKQDEVDMTSWRATEAALIAAFRAIGNEAACKIVEQDMEKVMRQVKAKPTGL
jgi:integrase